MEGYLLRRAAGFYFRIRVPNILRPVLGRSFIVRSLNTHDERLGRYLAASLSLLLGNAFAIAKQGGAMVDIKKTIQDHKDGKLREWTAKKVTIGGAVFEGVEITSEEDRQSVSKLIKEHSPPQETSGTTTRLKNNAGALSTLLEKFKETKTFEEIKGTTVTDYAICVQVFIDLVGDKLINHVVKTDIEKFRNGLLLLPRDFTKKAHLKGKPAFQAISINAALPTAEKSPVISKNTRRKYFGFVKTFFNWCKEEGHLHGDNILATKGWADQFKKEKTVRRVFADYDLTDIFSADNYKRHLITHPDEYWLPILALHTGCRVSELTQLRIVDFIKHRFSGIWYVYINENEETKKIKTEHAERIIPLHPVIIESGFLAYLEEVKAAGFDMVFPLLNWDDVKKNFSKEPMRHFTDYAVAIGVKKDNDRYNKTIHCFRHNLLDYFKNELGLKEEQYYEISGHKHKSIAEEYYTMPARLSTKQKVINAVKYDFIDWAALKYQGQFADTLTKLKKREPAILASRMKRKEKAEAHKTAKAAKEARKAKAKPSAATDNKTEEGSNEMKI
jgi:integrase